MKSLRESAAKAYNASPLKQTDDEYSAGSIAAIEKFLALFGVEKKIKSNPFKMEDLNFYGSPNIDSGGFCGYELKVSRYCSHCKDNIVFELPELCFSDFDIAEFGKWLEDPHLCEFETSSKPDFKIGF